MLNPCAGASPWPEVGFQPEHCVAVHEILYVHPVVLYDILCVSCIIVYVWATTLDGFGIIALSRACAW